MESNVIPISLLGGITSEAEAAVQPFQSLVLHVCIMLFSLIWVVWDQVLPVSHILELWCINTKSIKKLISDPQLTL